MVYNTTQEYNECCLFTLSLAESILPQCPPAPSRTRTSWHRPPRAWHPVGANPSMGGSFNLLLARDPPDAATHEYAHPTVADHVVPPHVDATTTWPGSLWSSHIREHTIKQVQIINPASPVEDKGLNQSGTIIPSHLSHCLTKTTAEAPTNEKKGKGGRANFEDKRRNVLSVWSLGPNDEKPASRVRQWRCRVHGNDTRHPYVPCCLATITHFVRQNITMPLWYVFCVSKPYSFFRYTKGFSHWLSIYPRVYRLQHSPNLVDVGHYKSKEIPAAGGCRRLKNAIVCSYGLQSWCKTLYIK